MPQANEPLSPHLQIYRWQLPMVLSITHRGTGIFLTLGTLLLVYWLIAIAAGAEAYAQAQALLGSPFGQIALLGWAFSLYFHLCNGVRHLVWDVGTGFELTSVYRSGYAVVVVSIALTAATWIYASGGSV